ncbi:anthrone oxygenase family protein [Leifsonia sp. NPDC058248]|uniref:anthrone oxygenase family protein n=1 Tax=Leifsonia sp. NPDC058248 TaxID=3346402 RepID=UPI0036DEB171
MASVLAVITATVVGLMVGVEFSVAFVINPIMLRLPAAASLMGRAEGGRMLGRAMPFWYVGSLILTAALTAVAWGTPAATSALIAGVLLAISVIMSIVLLVPINNRSTTWTPENHPDDWKEQQQRWDRLHYARVAIIVAAFVLVLVAATTFQL